MGTTVGRDTRGPVMWDVAAVAKVSQKTVSRVVNGSPNVSPAVRERVQDAIRQLGYRRNPAARALVTSRTHSIGVVAVGVPFFGPSSRVFSLERAARNHGYELALATPEDGSVDQVAEAIGSLRDRGVEGIVLELPAPLPIAPELLGGVPVTSSVGRIPGLEPQVVIGGDQRGAGLLATGYLLDLGHPSVAHISGPGSWSAALDRRRGWAEAHAVRGLRPTVEYEGDWSARSGYAAARRLLGEHPEVGAVWVANDQMAMGVLRAAAEAGRDVPGSLAVVGMDDVPEAEFQVVPLSTVTTDNLAISDRILTELVAVIEGRPPIEPIEYPHCLVVRRSSGPPTERSPG